jgi:putative transposase
MNKSYTKGQELARVLPAFDLIEFSREMVEQTMTEIGRIAIETVLSMSAVDVAGEPHRGREKGPVRHHGSQPGRVMLGGKRTGVDRPRLRSRDGHEVAVPAYEELSRDPSHSDRVLSRVVKGISTREYRGIFDEAGEELGLSKSNVSRQVAQAGEAALKALVERPIRARQLAVFVDGIHVGDSMAISAVGVDETGKKQVLGLSEGATESAASVGALLDSMIQRGVDPSLGILFVLDGAKALAKAVKDRFPNAVIQRCQIHKLRNVLDHLPENKRARYAALLTLAWKLPHPEALAKLEEIAGELEVLHPGAAASLREGMAQTLSVKKLGLPESLVRSLKSTNIVESSFSRAAAKLRRVTNFSGGKNAMNWLGTAMTLAEQGFRSIVGYRDIWALKAALDDLKRNVTLQEG